ncbi:unnamed protein product [Colias eurytheme]|nr:unnamed protein product [Colias eurytheme]
MLNLTLERESTNSEDQHDYKDRIVVATKAGISPFSLAVSGVASSTLDKTAQSIHLQVHELETIADVFLARRIHTKTAFAVRTPGMHE